MNKALKIAGITALSVAGAAVIADLVVTLIAAKKLTDNLENIPNLPECDEEGNTVCTNGDCKICQLGAYCHS